MPETRTNSLAFAKSDCHTCTANRVKCDRKRPRCSSCSGSNIICGGYPMQLKWSKINPKQPEVSVSSEQTHADDPFQLDPLSIQASFHLRSRIDLPRPRKPRNFRFVVEQAPIRRPPSTKSPQPVDSFAGLGESEEKVSVRHSSNTVNEEVTQSTPSSPLIDTYLDNAVHGRCLGDVHSSASNENAIFFPVDFSTDLLDWPTWPSTKFLDGGSPHSLDEWNNDHNTGTMSSATGDGTVRHPSPNSMMEHVQPNTPSLDSPILQKSILEKFETLLNMYDQNFCVMPLSRDIPSNPFRCRSETSRGSPSLLHAILAVSCHHHGRQASKDGQLSIDIVHHRNTALELYRAELNTYNKEQGLQLLDTTVVLFLFQATQSAFGNWATGISDAGKLLKLSGGEEVWAENRRSQAQIVMLLWWDATIALLSRQGCILPYSYLESLLPMEDDRYWNFFDLIGCPRELVVPLMQLATLAEENEKACSMRWTRFDLALVDEIQASIISWKNPYLDIDDEVSEEYMNQQRDRWHCTEVWRYGLLIYIMRVFRWDRNSSPPWKLALYARLILDHVHSCRQTAVVQKGTLLPLFLAGCETKDIFLRQSIRDYCQYWSGICGYNLFMSAASLLEDVWMEQDGFGGDEAWWGSVIDEKQTPNQSPIASMQFCFG